MPATIKRRAANQSCSANSWVFPVNVDFSGCPGDSPKATQPELGHVSVAARISRCVLNWQWEKVAIPYWTKRAKFAADHGVKIAIEMHPGFLVYNPENNAEAARAAVGPSVVQLHDPSHMFWQGIDPVAAIRILGDAIFHVHAKDTEVYDLNLPMTGVLDTKPYTDERNRAWVFRTCGYGHGEQWWAKLRLYSSECSAMTTFFLLNTKTAC